MQPYQNGEVIDLADMNFIGSGGAHKVYMAPDRPFEVLKTFNFQPSPAEVAFILDGKEFSGYLSGKIRIYRAAIRRHDGIREEFVILQPYCHDLKRVVVPVSISYWEIAHSMPISLTAERLFDSEDILRNFMHMEPEGFLLVSKIHDDMNLKKQVSVFLSNVEAYMERTGNILDFVGENNVIIVENGGQLFLNAIDVIKGDSFAAYESSIGRLGTLSGLNETAEVRPIVEIILNMHAFIRMMIVLGLAADYRIKMSWPVGIEPSQFEMLMEQCIRYRELHVPPQI